MCKSIFSVVGIAVIAALFFVGCGKKKTNTNEDMAELPPNTSEDIVELPLDPDKIPFGEDIEKVKEVYDLDSLDYELPPRLCEDTTGEYLPEYTRFGCRESRLVRIGAFKVLFYFDDYNKLSQVNAEYAGISAGISNEAIKTDIKKFGLLQKKVKQICNNRGHVAWITKQHEEHWESYSWHYNKNLYIRLSIDDWPSLQWIDEFGKIAYRRWSACVDSTPVWDSCEHLKTSLDSVKNAWLDSVGGVRCDSNSFVAYTSNGMVAGKCYYDGKISRITISYYVIKGDEIEVTGYDSIKWGASVNDVKRIYSKPKLKDITDSINASFGVRKFMQDFEYEKDDKWAFPEYPENNKEKRYFYFYNGKLCATERDGTYTFENEHSRYCDPDVAARVHVAGCDKFEDATEKDGYK